MQGVFNRLRLSSDVIELKKSVRKRFQRITNTLEDRAISELEDDQNEATAREKGRIQAALILAQNHSRRPDGVAQGLEIIEDSLFFSSGFAEAEISNIFSGYALQFCENLGRHNSSAEWKTNAPQIAMQRTFFALPHKGKPRDSLYSFTLAVHEKLNHMFSPATLMTLFLKGSAKYSTVEAQNPYNPANLGNAYPPVLTVEKQLQFDKFDADKAINLVYEAYQRGCQKVKVGKVLTYDNIINLINRDPYLQQEYERFSDALAEGNLCHTSLFFGSQESTDRWGGTYSSVAFKKPFFEYVLEKLGYIINPKSPWKSLEDNFLIEQKRNHDTKIAEIIACAEEASLKVNPTGNSREIVTDGKTIKVTTDNNALASYQLESDRLPVQPGKKIKIPYHITVEDGGIMSLGLLNTQKNGWYKDELVLKAGDHKGSYERIVPKGETQTSLVLRNYHLETPGQTTFTIKEIDIQKMDGINLKPTGLSQEVAEAADNSIKVTTDNNADASYQLESDRLPVKPGETITIPYRITVEDGGIMSLGLLNTQRNRWYGNEHILNVGNHRGSFERIVPQGETLTSLVFRNYHLGTPGQTTFTIKGIEIVKK